MEAAIGEQGFGRVEFEFDQPADVEMRIGAALAEPRQADGGLRCLGAEVFDLEFEPAFEFVGGDRYSWVAADGQLDHGPKLARRQSLRQWVSACIPEGPNAQPAPRALADRRSHVRTTCVPALRKRGQEGIDSCLTEHQREVLVGLALNGVPIDVLAERLNTTRGALYKTLHDARRKLRADLGERGFPLDSI